jgi:hypothetical protein
VYILITSVYILGESIVTDFHTEHGCHQPPNLGPAPVLVVLTRGHQLRVSPHLEIARDGGGRPGHETPHLGPGDPEQESFRKEAEMVASAGEIIRGAGLREDLKAIISAEQLTAFDEREAEVWQSQVESHAYTEFSKLVPVLGMSEEQKDRVFELLQESSAEILKTDTDERAFIAMQKGQAATQMDMPDPVEMEFIIGALEGPNPIRPDSPEFKERAFQVIGARIDERVSLLAPVLDEQQKQRYREYLVKQSMLSQFPAELPKPE